MHACKEKERYMYECIVSRTPQKRFVAPPGHPGAPQDPQEPAPPPEAPVPPRISLEPRRDAAGTPRSSPAVPHTPRIDDLRILLEPPEGCRWNTKGLPGNHEGSSGDLPRITWTAFWLAGAPQRTPGAPQSPHSRFENHQKPLIFILFPRAGRPRATSWTLRKMYWAPRRSLHPPNSSSGHHQRFLERHWGFLGASVVPYHRGGGPRERPRTPARGCRGPFYLFLQRFLQCRRDPE